MSDIKAAVYGKTGRIQLQIYSYTAKNVNFILISKIIALKIISKYIFCYVYMRKIMPLYKAIEAQIIFCPDTA